MIETDTGPLPVVDADSHLIEPADVWTSRLPKKFVDQAPRVELNPRTGHHHWRIGSKFIWPVGFFDTAGFDRCPPEFPYEYEDADPGGYDPIQRLKRMDEYGVDVQILFPNVIGFQGQLILEELGPEVALLCTSAYNDFAVDWCREDPRRLIPIAMLPYWDVEASVAEMRRCVAAGHRGILFADKFERVGLPEFTNSHWDPIYAEAQDLDVSVNFHVGFASPELSKRLEDAESADSSGTSDVPIVVADHGPRELSLFASSVLLTQADVIGKLLTSGLCDRFPAVKLVAVESGFGYLPFYLEALDWHWRNYGNHKPGALLPSEYFKRQCYGTLWFERTTLPLLSEFADNFMFSTDYPHGTSLSPGPVSAAELPSAHVTSAFRDIAPELTAKTVCTNAQRVYGLDI